MKKTLLICSFILGVQHVPLVSAETRIRVYPGNLKHEFGGLGCGVIFYERHITSLAKTNKWALQKQLFDEMFRDVRTDYLHLMIRHDHEPANDNADPRTPAFRDEWFEYCQHNLSICEAAKRRRPEIRLHATLYTPPPWMKTNGDVSGGGEERATLKDGFEVELAEFCWAFCDYMRRHGQPIDSLSICNEPDWPHTQPGYSLTPIRHVQVFLAVATYLKEMSRRHPETPMPKLVAPNTLSAVSAAREWLPPLMRRARDYVDVVGCHDYDRRPDRWSMLARISGNRPVWCTEWSFNHPDDSADLVRSSAQYWRAMSEAFNGGANVWMAYDWVYPPRAAGEALIHVNWGKDWKCTKIYDGFRQFANPLMPGMRVAHSEVLARPVSGSDDAGAKAVAFFDPTETRLVVHVANVQDKTESIAIELPRVRTRLTARLTRTSQQESLADLGEVTMETGRALKTELPAWGLLTLVFTK